VVSEAAAIGVCVAFPFWWFLFLLRNRGSVLFVGIFLVRGAPKHFGCPFPVGWFGVGVRGRFGERESAAALVGAALALVFVLSMGSDVAVFGKSRSAADVGVEE
jgi:hypothetical protein